MSLVGIGNKLITRNNKALFVQTSAAPYTIEGLDVESLPLAQMFTPTDAYKGNGPTDYTLANCPSLSDFYTLFYDTYIGRNIPNYSVTKKSLGKDQSGTYDLWEYDFCPTHWERMILLTSGMNGYEIAATFGLAYFLQQVIENHANDDVLDYIFRKVRIKVIPHINPWGYAQSPKSYTQSRGVNINRNFDYDGMWESYDPSGNPNNNKGSAPFSEAETKILRTWAEENLGAEFWIDCHAACAGLTVDKDLYTSALSDSVMHTKLLKAQTLLVDWTKDFYNLSSVTTNFVYDSDAAIKQYWYEGTFHRGMLVIEQCSDCAAIGNVDNGSANSIYNYFMLIYACVGCFLEIAERVISDTNGYINELTQDYIEAQKYYVADNDTPTPTPTPTNYLTLKQGGLSSSNGQPTESNTRVYIEEYIPTTNSQFHVLNAADNDISCFMRSYANNNSFVGTIAAQSDNFPGMYYVNETSGTGTKNDLIIAKRSAGNATKIRIAFCFADKTTPIVPSDLNGRVITVDGIEYTLRV